jgi:serine/threonine protein kinase
MRMAADAGRKGDKTRVACGVPRLVASRDLRSLLHACCSFRFCAHVCACVQFVDGGSILDKIKKQGKPLNEEQIAYVVHEVLLGLDYLSRAHKIHRDIKAANILLSKSGHVKLADFGATAQLTDTMTKCSTFVGSPYWMVRGTCTRSSFLRLLWAFQLSVCASVLLQRHTC